MVQRHSSVFVFTSEEVKNHQIIFALGKKQSPPEAEGITIVKKVLPKLTSLISSPQSTLWHFDLRNEA